MRRITKKITGTAVCALLALGSTISPFAASIDTVQTYNLDESLKDVINKSPEFIAVPDEIIEYYNSQGGKITFRDSLNVNGQPAGGVYNTGDKSITMSLQSVKEGFPNMVPYYLVHELGHFIYFHGNLTAEDREVLNGLMQRYPSKYTLSDDSAEETFASQYAAFKNGGYYLNESEKKMFTRVEQSVIDRMLSGDVSGPSAESDYHYRGTWKSTDSGWTYEENGKNLADTWALVFTSTGTKGEGYRKWYHFNESGIMDAEQDTAPEI